MSNIPHQGHIDPDDWGELLSALWERNPKVQQSFAKFEQVCRDLYRKLQKKGYPDEDIREILFMTDLVYEMETAYADATMQIMEENSVEVTMMVKIPEDQTELQQRYLRMLQEKYKTSSGCRWGIQRSPEE